MHHAPRNPRRLVLPALGGLTVAAGIAAALVTLPAGASTGYGYGDVATAADSSTAVPAAGATPPAGTALQPTPTAAAAAEPADDPETGGSTPPPAEPPAPKQPGGTAEPPGGGVAAQADPLTSTRVATRGRGRLMASTLTGNVVVPGAGDAAGVGIAAVRVESGKVCLEATVTGLAGITEAHIHRGTRGTAGPVVVTFPVVGPARAAGCVRVDPALTQRILVNPENWYVDVHTAGLARGALRGQLMW